MSDLYDEIVSGKTDTKTAETSEILRAANKAGAWFAWAGLGFALLWWAGSIIGLLSLVSPSWLAEQPLTLIIASGILVILPGLLILAAGFVARQSKRTSEANILILMAADTLLAPARKAAHDMANIGQSTRNTTLSINQTVTQSLGALREMSEALSKERLRAESVSYAMADNARDLTRRLSEERQALEALSKALEQQTGLMSDAIPLQAAAMVEATNQVSTDIGRAEAGLDQRLDQLKQAGSTLAVRLMDLDAVARDAASRTDALDQTITRIENRLNKVHKTVEMAEKAGAMAVDAAAMTGDALRDAVSSALDDARNANREISETAQQLQTRQVEARQTEARPLEESVPRQGKHLPPAAQLTPPEQLPPPDQKPMPAPEIARPEKAATPKPAYFAGTSFSAPSTDETTLFEPAPAPRPKPAPEPVKPPAPVIEPELDPIAETRPDVDPEELFDFPTEPADLVEAEPEERPAKTNGTDALELGDADAPVLLNTQQPETEPTDAAEETLPATGQNGATPGNGSMEWRDIIADIGSEAEAEEHYMPSDAAAEALIQRLQSTGIPLQTAFRVREKKKIAAAARKDVKTRRTVIRNVAGNEVDRVAIRLKKDRNLMALARTFVSHEEDDALRDLADPSGPGRHASVRLAAFLLVDTALERTTH